MTDQNKWQSLGYEQVPGLANRHIARYLRMHRKTMLRFFQERGFPEYAERMAQIRLSRQGMMAKNRMFQEVLDDYARMVSPPVPGEGGAPQESAPEAALAATERSVDLQPEPMEQPVPSGPRDDAGAGVHDVAHQGDGSGMVIEE
jgi:hypothetical protein